MRLPLLEFYQPYLETDGRQRIAQKIKNQVGNEGEDLTAARQCNEEELKSITQTINNLLDNLTATNRDHVDHRLKDLADQRKQLENRLDELDLLALSQNEITEMVNEAMQFISGLGFTLRQGVPQEKLVVLRQCIQRIRINKPKIISN